MPEREKYISWGDYIRVARFAGTIKKELLGKIALGLLICGTYVVQAILLGKGSAAVFASRTFGGASVFYAFVLVCIAVRAFLSKHMEAYTKIIGGKLKQILRERIVGKLLDLGPGYQSDKRSGRFQSLVTDGVEYIEPYLVNYLPQLVLVLLEVGAMVIYILSKDMIAGLVVLFGAIMGMAMPHILMPFYTKSIIGYWQEYAVLNSQFIDTMQGMNTLKLFNAGALKGEELKESSENFRRRQTVNTRNSLFSTGGIAVFSSVITAVAGGAAAYSCFRHQLAPSDLFVIIFLTIECVRPIGELNTAWHSSMMGFSVASELLEILNEPLRIVTGSDALEEGLEALPSICFDDVSFCYNEQREDALKHITMNILPGQTVAIVGSSGSGKSTIVNLLLRFYDRTQGALLLAGRDIRDFDLDYLRSRTSVIFQYSYLFYATIRENISIAKPDATMDEIIAAAKAANAHDFIMRMPDAYDTMVGERGDTLSGGQRQRIAIARAILKSAPILIMDEATSSVDAASETMIQETTEALRGRYTTVIIAHRLSTIRNVGRIFVLDNGELVESGTHDELYQRRGVYYRLVEAQNEGNAV